MIKYIYIYNYYILYYYIPHKEQKYLLNIFSKFYIFFSLDLYVIHQ